MSVLNDFRDILRVSHAQGKSDLKSAYLSILLLSLICVGCDDSDLRGKFSKSVDGKTYLAVIDDNGRKCGSITVDGKDWERPIDRPREIAPGKHVIKCGGEIGFTIPEGVTYKFNYWGP